MSETKPSNIIIPSDPKTKQAIRLAVIEISNSLTRKKAESDNITAIIQNMKEKCDIPGAIIRKMGQTYYSQNMADQLSDFEDFEALYDTIFVTAEVAL